MVTRTTPYNSTYPKGGVSCSKSSFVVKIATFAKPETVIGQCKKTANRTVKHIWFFPTHKPKQKNQKSLPLPTHDKIVDIYTIRQCNFTIFDLLKIH